MEVIMLRERFSKKIKKIKPFNYLFTFWKPSHFYTGLELHSRTCTWRTFRFSKDLLVGAKIIDEINDINIIVYTNIHVNEETQNAVIDRIIYSYGLKESYNVKIDNSLIKNLLKKFEGTRISCPESLYEISIISLVLQNATIKRTVQMLSNLLDNYGKVVEFDNKVLKMFFSPIEMLKINDVDLKETCRLGYRYKYIIPYSEFFCKNTDDYLMSLDQSVLLKEFQKIKGVGPYTSNILASHVLRSKANVGLDCWNTKIIGEFLYDNSNISMDELYFKLNNDFGENMGIICTFIIENTYINNPSTQLID